MVEDGEKTGKEKGEVEEKEEEEEGEDKAEREAEGEGEGEEEGEGTRVEMKKTVEEVQAEVELEDSLKVITQLTKFIYNRQSEALGRIRTRAMLCQIYHHALHDRCLRTYIHVHVYTVQHVNIYLAHIHY